MLCLHNFSSKDTLFCFNYCIFSYLFSYSYIKKTYNRSHKNFAPTRLTQQPSKILCVRGGGERCNEEQPYLFSVA